MKKTITIKIGYFAICLAVISVSLINSGCGHLRIHGPRYTGLSHPSKPHYKLNVIVLNPEELPSNATFHIKLDRASSKKDIFLIGRNERGLTSITEKAAQRLGCDFEPYSRGLIYDEKEYNKAFVIIGIQIPMDCKGFEVYTSTVRSHGGEHTLSNRGKKISIIPTQNENYTIVYRFDDAVLRPAWGGLDFIYTPYVNYSWGSSWNEPESRGRRVIDLGPFQW